MSGSEARGDPPSAVGQSGATEAARAVMAAGHDCARCAPTAPREAAVFGSDGMLDERSTGVAEGRPEVGGREDARRQFALGFGTYVHGGN